MGGYVMYKKQKPFIAFLGGVIKRWWWIMGSGIGGIQTILATINLTFPLNKWWLGVVIIVVCLFVAMYLAFKDVYIQLQAIITKPSVIKLQSRKITMREEIVINKLAQRMKDVHGDADYDGIRQDMVDGIDTNDILKRDCLGCGKPRNEHGDHYDE